MKKLLLIAVLLMVFCVPVKAELDLSNLDATALELPMIPATKVGILWDFDDESFKPAFAMPLLEKGSVSLDLGYSVKNTAYLSLNYKLNKLEDYGINLPIIRKFQPEIGYYGGYEHIDMNTREAKHGLSITILKITL